MDLTNFSFDKSNWRKVKLGDVVVEHKESVKDPIAEGIEHVVGLEHIDTEDIHLRRSANIEESTTFTKKFHKDDVLFGRRRAYLKKAAQASFSGICSGDITVMRVKENLLPELLPFVINNEKFFDYAITHSAGSLSPRVKFKDLANYEFLLPTKDQQAKLAELLWAMNELLESYNQTIYRIEILRNSILNDLFSFKSSNSRKIAGIDVSSFKKRKFSEICTESMFGPRFSSNLYDLEGNVASLRTTDLSNEGEINLQTMPRAKIPIGKFEDHYLKPKDLVISRSGTCGIAAVFDNYDIPVIPAAFLIRFRLSKSVNPYYLRLFFNSLIGREITSKVATGAVQKNLTSKAILAIEIPVPSLHIQNGIVKLINDLNIQQFKSLLLNTKSLQKSLTNQIF